MAGVLKGKRVERTIAFDLEAHQFLEEVARAEGGSLQEVVRRLVDDFMEKVHLEGEQQRLKTLDY